MSEMSVEEMIRNSQCFGIAYDDRVPECRACDVKTKCDAKCRSTFNMIVSRPAPTVMAEIAEITANDDDIPKKAKPAKPEPKPEPKAKPAEKPKPEPKPEKPEPEVKKPAKITPKAKSYSNEMPAFRGLSMEELEKMAVDRGAVLADFDKYIAPNIRRMRLTMFIKKTYEI